MTITNWEITREDHDLLVQVADRALSELAGYPDDKHTLIMDLNACHANACALDFKGLLEAPLQDFSHDICGIRQHINRDTGKLEDFFTPRYARSNERLAETALYELTELVYTDIDPAGPWALYIFGDDGLHSGRQYFAKVVQYPDEEITIAEAKAKAAATVASKHEVRICDMGDMVVFHSKDGRTIYGGDFWETIEA
jgi:hypothetical protein